MMNPSQADEALAMTNNIEKVGKQQFPLKHSQMADYRVQVDSTATMSIRVMHAPTQQVKTQYVGPQMLSSDRAVQAAMLYLIQEFDAEFGRPQIIKPG